MNIILFIFTIGESFMKIVFFILLSISYLSSPLASELPLPFTAQYSLYAEGLPIGEGTRRLVHEKEGKFRLESTSHTTGLTALFRNDSITENSVFIMKNGEIQALEYHYALDSSKRKKFEDIQFNWQNRKATYKDDERTAILTLENGVFDKLLYQWILMQDLQQGKREFVYKIINKGKIKTYVLEFQGKETINTGLGEVEALKYMRTSSNRNTVIWCAPSLHYLPIRVDHVEKGSTMSMVLDSVIGLQ
jgi:hypothetical protein